MAHIVDGNRQFSAVEQGNGVVRREKEVGAGGNREGELNLLGQRIAASAAVNDPYICSPAPGELLQARAVSETRDRDVVEPLDDPRHDSLDVYADARGINPAQINAQLRQLLYLYVANGMSLMGGRDIKRKKLRTGSLTFTSSYSLLAMAHAVTNHG